MPPKFEAEDIVFQRDVEKAQLLAGLADHRRARHACIVCDRFLGDAPETAVTLNRANPGRRIRLADRFAQQLHFRSGQETAPPSV